MEIDMRWTLNEKQGKYTRTNIVDSDIDVVLNVKRANGSIEEVGHFRLPLEGLAKTGFVGRRVVGDNRVFHVTIHREANGSYSLGVHPEKTTPLAPYATP